MEETLKTKKELEDTKFKVPLGRLKFNESFNYKNVTRQSIDKLKRSLLEDGQLTPILVNAVTEMVIGGSHQYVAIKELIEEGKWEHGDLVWIEPRVVKDNKHEKVLALKHNTQYDIPAKEKVAEWGVDLLDSGYSLADIPLITDFPEINLIDAVDYVSPKEGEKDPTRDVKEKEVQCPNCGHRFII